MAFVIELVMFRAKPGIAVETVVEAAEGTRQAVAGLDGYADRNFGATADGEFVDVIRWRDRACAEAAAAAAPRLAGFDRFRDVIDTPSVQVYHLDGHSPGLARPPLRQTLHRCVAPTD